MRCRKKYAFSCRKSICLLLFILANNNNVLAKPHIFTINTQPGHYATLACYEHHHSIKENQDLLHTYFLSTELDMAFKVNLLTIVIYNNLFLQWIKIIYQNDNDLANKEILNQEIKLVTQRKTRNRNFKSAILLLDLVKDDGTKNAQSRFLAERFETNSLIN